MYEGYLVLVSLFFTALVSRYVHFTCDFLTFDEHWERMTVYMLLFF